MSDLHVSAPEQMSDDAILRQIVVASAAACLEWATPTATGRLDMLLYPRDRGPIERQQPYTVTAHVAEVGIWRIALCPRDSLPAGVPVTTRDSVIRMLTARSTTDMSAAAMDHAIQCGLFGEVIYR